MAFKAKTGKNKHRNHNTDEALKELTKDELKGFHVQLPTDLHRDFKMKAAENGEKMKDVVVRMVREYSDK